MMRDIFSLVLVAVIHVSIFAQEGSTGSKVTAQIVKQESSPVADQSVLKLEEVVSTARAKNPAVQSAQ